MAKKNRKAIIPELGNIYLTGFMCAGKTSAGRALARALGRPFRDSDLRLERETGKKIYSLVGEQGLRRFRALEAALVTKLSEGRGQVIALGGGVYPSRRWEGLLKRTGTVVFLYCPWPGLESRLKAARGPRPLLSGPWEKAGPRAKKLYAARLPFYRRADLTVNTAGLSPDRAAELIVKKI